MTIIQQIQQAIGAKPDGIMGAESWQFFEEAKSQPPMVREMEQILGTDVDGIWGTNDQTALDAVLNPPAVSIAPPEEVHQVKASSFADPKDVAAYRKCKAEGHNDQYCFKIGDNGIGCWNDDCAGETPCCALPPEDWLAKWGSGSAAHGKIVIVTANGKTVKAKLWDTMPHKANIKNGAGLDMGPALVAALGLTPPVMISATWSWA